MLQLIKGSGISQYMELLEQTDDYKFQLYLDEAAHRLYVDGKPLDSHIKVKYGSDEDYIPNLSYIFMDENGNEVELNEVHITDIDDHYNMVLRDTEAQKDAPNIYNGLMSVRDKFVLDCIAKALGVEISYEYYANVNHYSDYKNGNLDIMTDVDVTMDPETGDWFYSYESFDYTVTNAAGDNELITAPAGTRTVAPEAVLVKSIHFDYVSDNINTIYDAGLDAEQEVPFTVGGIEAGTTVADLEKKTVSGVLTDMLFPVYEPVKVADASLEFGFVYDDNFKEVMEVGSEYPRLDNFYYKFTPETWMWKRPCSCDGVVDSSQYTMNPEPEKVEIWFHDHDNECNAIKTYVQDPDDPSCYCNVVLVDSNDYIDAITNTTSKHDKYVIKEDSKNFFTCVAYFTEGEYPANSDGISLDASGNFLYADVSSGKIKGVNPANAKDEDNWNKLFFNTQFTGAWKIYSNANIMSNESLWKHKLVNPGEFEGNDAINIEDSEIFAMDGVKFYVQWTNRTAKDEHFYIYVPSHYEIVSVNGAHDATCEEYSAQLSFVVDSSLELTNKFDMTREYNKYELSKQAGITTACVVIKKLEE